MKRSTQKFNHKDYYLDLVLILHKNYMHSKIFEYMQYMCILALLRFFHVIVVDKAYFYGIGKKFISGNIIHFSSEGKIF